MITYEKNKQNLISICININQELDNYDFHQFFSFSTNDNQSICNHLSTLGSDFQSNTMWTQNIEHELIVIILFTFWLLLQRIGFHGKSVNNVSTITITTTTTSLSVSKVKSDSIYCEDKTNYSTDQLKIMDWIKVNRIQLTAFVIAFVSFICFIPSTSNDFVFDDIPTIINNKDVTRTEKSITRIFFNDYWGTPINKVIFKQLKILLI